MSEPRIRRADGAGGSEPAAVAPVAPVTDERVVVEPVAAPVQPTAVVQPVVATTPLQPVERQRGATRSSRRLAPDSIIVGLIGLALLVIGLIAVARAGLDGPMDQPVVEVLGFTHTALLGIIEAALGLCLLICAAATSRAGAIFFGLVLAVAGVVGAVQTSTFRRTLALESSFAWIAAAAGGVVVLVSLLIPRTTVETTRVESA